LPKGRQLKEELQDPLEKLVALRKLNPIVKKVLVTISIENCEKDLRRRAESDERTGEVL